MSETSQVPPEGGRIRWERGDYSERGLVGDLALFTVGYEKRDTYYVRTTLPGFKRDITRPSADEAKALCDFLLDRFLHRLGASWTPQPSGDQEGAS